MMSAFFVRVVVLSDMAWAMALSSSRSLPSRTDRSSCCSAVIGLLFWEVRQPGYLPASGKEISRRRRACVQTPSPRDHRCVLLSRDRLYPRTALQSAEG